MTYYELKDIAVKLTKFAGKEPTLKALSILLIEMDDNTQDAEEELLMEVLDCFYTCGNREAEIK